MSPTRATTRKPRLPPSACAASCTPSRALAAAVAVTGRTCPVPRLGRVPSPALQVENLSKRYGTVTALDGVTFTAPAGRITAVLGRNGAGKTTTLDICAGLRAADGGSVRLLGLDPTADRAGLRERVGVMPQTGGSGAAGIYPSIRPREAIRLFASFYAQPHDADALLDRVDLAPVANTPWRRLSGGEQQRLSLALALVGRPELVFLDEPSAGLDVHARLSMWQLLEDLRSSGVTVVLTTHTMEEAERLADQIVVIDHGRTVATGTIAELAGSAAPALSFEATPGLPVDHLSAALPAGTTARETEP